MGQDLQKDAGTQNRTESQEVEKRSQEKRENELMSEPKKKSVFETLSAIDCSDHVETLKRKSKKTGRVTYLSYLSWAWAWAILKRYYPDSTYQVYKDEHGCIYHTDGRTAWVEVGVTVDGLEHVEMLPVMDYNNNAIPLERLTSFEANTAVQRALTKAIARHGLGLYIYAGEDIPPKDAEEPEDKPAVSQKAKAEPKQAKGVKKPPEPYKLAQIVELTDDNPPKVERVTQEKPEGKPPVSEWQHKVVELWRSKGAGTKRELVKRYHLTRDFTEDDYKKVYAQIVKDFPPPDVVGGI